MQTVSVSASTQYDVIIGNGARRLLTDKVKALFGAPRVCVVSDARVAALHLAALEDDLRQAGLDCVHYIFPQGEQSKTPATLVDLLEFLAQSRLSRKDVLVALGGGVTGDLGGLASALYMRGMRLIQMPTSLLAMVDSSVGGKTAVDLRAGKNLAGVFRQPNLVLCDTDYLGTLSEDDFRDGMAEVIKYGVLGDKDLFDRVKDGVDRTDMTDIITRCVEMKRDIVGEDEFDTGRRALLNFGHTLGHAIEANSNFTVSHGKAVAIGMVRIAALAEQAGFCDAPCCEEIKAALQKNGLPTDCALPNAALIDAVTADKKCAGGSITLILPKSIGECRTKKITVDTLKELLQ